MTYVNSQVRVQIYTTAIVTLGVSFKNWPVTFKLMNKQTIVTVFHYYVITSVGYTSLLFIFCFLFLFLSF